MTLVGWAQIALVLAVVLGCAIPLSKFIAEVYAGEKNVLSPVFGPVERGFYRLAGVDVERQSNGESNAAKKLGDSSNLVIGRAF
jgi:potassium-transporting ATPase potassium-binding subunit